MNRHRAESADLSLVLRESQARTGAAALAIFEEYSTHGTCHPRISPSASREESVVFEARLGPIRAMLEWASRTFASRSRKTPRCSKVDAAARAELVRQVLRRDAQ